MDVKVNDYFQWNKNNIEACAVDTILSIYSESKYGNALLRFGL